MGVLGRFWIAPKKVIRFSWVGTKSNHVDMNVSLKHSCVCLGFCRGCMTGKHVALLKTSYSNKLLWQEFLSMHVWPKLSCTVGDKSLSDLTTMEQLHVDSYYKLQSLPKPESWEFAKFGVSPHNC